MALEMAKRSLEWALEKLEAYAAVQPYPEEDVRPHACYDMLRRMVEQRGCEEHDPAVTDGKLTTLIDVIIFG